MLIVGLALAGVSILTLTAAAGFGLMHTSDDDDNAKAPVRAARRRQEPADAEDEDSDGEPGFGLVSLGAAIHLALTLKGAIRRMFAATMREREPGGAPARAPWLDPRARAFSLADDEPADQSAPRRVETSFRGGAPAPAAHSAAAASAAAAVIASRVAAPAGPL